MKNISKQAITCCQNHSYYWFWTPLKLRVFKEIFQFAENCKWAKQTRVKNKKYQSLAVRLPNSTQEGRGTWLVLRQLCRWFFHYIIQHIDEKHYHGLLSGPLWDLLFFLFDNFPKGEHQALKSTKEMSFTSKFKISISNPTHIWYPMFRSTL